MADGTAGLHGLGGGSWLLDTGGDGTEGGGRLGSGKVIAGRLTAWLGPCTRGPITCSVSQLRTGHEMK